MAWHTHPFLPGVMSFGLRAWRDAISQLGMATGAK
jgi:hypothetical protein